MFSVRTILHPTDFSESSEFAFRVAGALARDYGAQLIILHVAPMPAFAFGQGVVLPQQDGYSEALSDKMHQWQSSDSSIPLDYQKRDGNPASAILRVAKEARVDLIVMGTHGRRTWPHLQMGSVAEQVVRDAACPVLTVKTPMAAGGSEHGKGRTEPLWANKPPIEDKKTRAAHPFRRSVPASSQMFG